MAPALMESIVYQHQCLLVQDIPSSFALCTNTSSYFHQLRLAFCRAISLSLHTLILQTHTFTVILSNPLPSMPKSKYPPLPPQSKLKPEATFYLP